MPERADLIVIGGGIIGLSVAHEFQARNPGAAALVLEKEPTLAAHQTGRNSGVIHSGIYYKPGSLKATTCRRGIDLLETFCDEHAIARERCGKVIVALDDAESARLDAIYERGIANGVSCELIDRDRLLELEPHCAARRAIHVHDTGIVDYPAVSRALAACIENAGGCILHNARVASIQPESDSVTVTDEAGRTHRATRLANCAGLFSDRIARLAGTTPPARIVPFRGEYFELRPEARSLVSNLIYPVPDPSFPFLGVHFTRMIDRDDHGHRVECGPNAVLALAREGYTKTTVRPRDLLGTLTYPAFWRLAARHWRTGLAEMHRSFSKSAFTKALQRLVPAIGEHDLVPAPAGVRAQALGPDARLLDDFVLQRHGPVLHVVNAPSPAATASLAIAERIVDELQEPL